MTKLLVVHFNGQEILGEFEKYENDRLYLKNMFEINREHMAINETIGTMIILDPLGENDGDGIPKSQCLVRKPTADETKSFERITAQMSNIVKPTAKDFQLIKS